MKKVKIILASLFTIAIIAINFSIVGNTPIYRGDFSLNSLQKAFADGTESSGGTETYGDRFELDVSTTFTAYVEVDASNIITKAAGVSFSGSIEVQRTVEYTCCKNGGGQCSKVNPQCENISVFDLIKGSLL